MIFQLSKQWKATCPYCVNSNISDETAGEIWTWSLLGVKGLAISKSSTAVEAACTQVPRLNWAWFFRGPITVIHADQSTSGPLKILDFNPSTRKSDQCQISPAASPEI